MTRFVLVSLALLAVALIAVSVSHVDVSALRDFERDVTMMRQPDPSPDRYFDPSGHSVWLSSDLLVWDSLHARELPLWERLQGGGYSTINGGYSGVLHPARWIVALVPRSSAPTALIVVIEWIAMAGMYALARYTFESSRAASVLAAVAFGFSSVIVSMAHFSGASLPLAHIPWIVFWLRREGRAATFALVITIALLFVSGHPLLEVCALAAAGFVVLADSVTSRSVRPILRFAFATIAGVLIAAPAWLPPVLSRNELWTYKTQTEKGVSYFAYPMADWATAVRAMIVDLYDRDGCCIDLAAFFVYVGVAAAILAAVGAILHRRMRAVVVLLVVAFVFAIPGPWMEPLHTIPPLSFFKPWYLIGAFAFFLALLVGAGFDVLWGGTRVRRAIAVVLALVACAMYVERAANVVFRPRILRNDTGGDALRFLRADRDVFRITTLWGQTHMPNASRVTGVEDLRFAGPVLTGRYDLFWFLVDPYVVARGYPTTRVTDVLESPLVGDFNVKYVLQSRLRPGGTFRNDRAEASRDTLMSPRIASMPVVARTPWVEVRQNTRGYRPRAHFAAEVVRVPSLADAGTLLSHDRTLPERAEVVETDAPVHGGRGTARVTYRGNRFVSIDVESDTGGLVVLHDSFARGWTATVDGTPAAIVPVNVLSRGVMVKPGRHTIRMSYMPPAFVAASAFSAVALLLAALFVRRLQFVQV